MTSHNSRSAFLEQTANRLGYNTEDMCSICQGFHRSEDCPHSGQTAVKPSSTSRQKVIDELNEALEPPKSPLSRREEGHQREWEEQRQLRHEAEARRRLEHVAHEDRLRYEKFCRLYDEQVRLRDEGIRQREVELGIEQAIETHLVDNDSSDADDDADDDAEVNPTAAPSKQGDKGQSKNKGKDKAKNRGRKVVFAPGSSNPKSKR